MWWTALIGAATEADAQKAAAEQVGNTAEELAKADAALSRSNTYSSLFNNIYGSRQPKQNASASDIANSFQNKMLYWIIGIVFAVGILILMYFLFFHKKKTA